MVTPMSYARREAEADAAAASKIPAALGGIGLATASTAVTLAACQPPPGFDNTTYLLTLSVALLAGVTQVAASVWVYDDVRGRRAAGNKFLYASIAPVVAAVGLSVLSLLW